jgi:methylenetetrahydrofolate dehydrogenase (NADP+)/methenyltetrahydrofolate cyclohydrolase
MPAQLLEGRPAALALQAEIKFKVQAVKRQGINPTLKVLLAGNDEASLIYAGAKSKLAAALGITVQVHHLPASAQTAEALELLEQWRQEREVHGVMLELPLPARLDKTALLTALDPLKDVDGLHPLNLGNSLMGAPAIPPATPAACLALLDYYGIELAGKRVTLVGRGDTVGRPLLGLLLKRDATITICHSKTKDLARHCRQAEVVIAAAGVPGLITASMLNEGAIVVDAGINQQGSGICGDVDPLAAEAAAWLSPVPGGVGALTTTIIMKNLLTAVARQQLPGGQ